MAATDRTLSEPSLRWSGEHEPQKPLESPQRYRGEREAHGKGYESRVVGNTDHGWLIGKSDAYHEQSAEEAWAIFTTFLRDVFAGKWHSDRALWRFQSDSALDYSVGALRERLAAGRSATYGP